MTEIPRKHIWPTTGIADLDSGAHELGASEIPGIRAVWQEQKRRLDGTSALGDFVDRLVREWAIETGIVENLYDIDRGVTQTLIEGGFRADIITHGSANRPPEFVIRLLNDQKGALEGIFAFVKNQRPLSSGYIKELHAALLRSQTKTDAVDALGRPVEVELIKGDWKKLPNSPLRDGVTYEYCPPEHVASEMDRLIGMHRQHVADGVPSDVAAAWLHHRFAQIHPFQDGNGRVARAIASHVLIKDELFPLIITRDDKIAYLDALETADDGELAPLVELFGKIQKRQFVRATALSERAIEMTIGAKAALRELAKKAAQTAGDKQAAYATVFERAREIGSILRNRLDAVVPDIRNALLHTGQTSVWVSFSNDSTAYYYRAQIIRNARQYLGYFANRLPCQSWVALNMNWRRRARLVFAIHGIGQVFSGSLICAPFLEFLDTDGEGEDRQTSSSLVPVTDEGFVFFHTDSPDRVLARFDVWYENVLKVFVRELGDNL